MTKLGVSSTQAYLDKMTQMLQRLDADAVEAFADAVFDAWCKDRAVFVFGNGGSAYNASHYVADLVKTAEVPGQRRLRAFSLSDNVGILTALSNDVSYDNTFLYPLQTYATEGDLAVAISCSGNSPNVVNACQWAKDNGMDLVGLTGFAGGQVGQIADIHVNIPSENYGVMEDLHMSVGHIVAQRLQQRVKEAITV
ncbi:MAG: SIS domain-containing protein [Phycisphaeraceae bacterium]